MTIRTISNPLATVYTRDSKRSTILVKSKFRKILIFDLSGSLSNTMLIIMGDHGQRMHFSQVWIPWQRAVSLDILDEICRSNRGEATVDVHVVPERIQETISIRVWKPTHKCESTNLVSLTNTAYYYIIFSRNVDIHETLLDIIDNRFGKTRPEGRGRSLFTLIPTTRTCTEAWIPKNFCLCQYKVTMEEKTSEITHALH